MASTATSRLEELSGRGFGARATASRLDIRERRDDVKYAGLPEAPGIETRARSSDEHRRIPQEFPIRASPGLSSEVIQRLTQVQPGDHRPGHHGFLALRRPRSPFFGLRFAHVLKYRSKRVEFVKSSRSVLRRGRRPTIRGWRPTPRALFRAARGMEPQGLPDLPAC